MKAKDVSKALHIAERHLTTRVFSAKSKLVEVSKVRHNDRPHAAACSWTVDYDKLRRLPGATLLYLQALPWAEEITTRNVALHLQTILKTTHLQSGSR